MATPVRLGIVGLGRAGWGMHCDELKGREDKFVFAAACDVIPDRRQKMAERYGCAVYERVEDLVKDPNVEVVDIASRSDDHFAHARLALKAGKHVFLEKPMSVNYKEAQRLLALAAKSKGKLYIRHNRRYEPAFQHIREIIASGILGEVFEIRLQRLGYQRRDDWQTLMSCGGGLLLNWGPHIVDHALRLLGAPVAKQWSDLKRIAAVGDAEDHFKIILTGTNGRLVELQVSGAMVTGQAEYLIWGSKGALTCAGEQISLKYLDPDKVLAPRQADPGTPGTGFGNPDQLTWIEKTIPVSPAKKVDMNTIWDDLYATLREGVPFPILLDEALEVIKVISAAKKGTPFAN